MGAPGHGARFGRSVTVPFDGVGEVIQGPSSWLGAGPVGRCCRASRVPMRRVSRLTQRGTGLGEGIDDVVRDFFEERFQGGGDRPVPQEGQADTAPFPQCE